MLGEDEKIITEKKCSIVLNNAELIEKLWQDPSAVGSVHQY